MWRISLNRCPFNGGADRFRIQQFIESNWCFCDKPTRHQNQLVVSGLSTLRVVKASLCDEALGPVASEFHENAGSTCLATDSISLTVERFETAANCTFVINEFNHNVRLRFTRLAFHS